MSKRYELMVEKALLAVVKEALSNVAQNGDLSSNEIYVTFLLNNGVQASQKLKALYKNKLSILIQKNYHTLKIENDFFEIELDLQTGTEKLIVPFKSVLQFIDKTNEFALKFTPENVNPQTFPDNEPILDNMNDEKVIQVDFTKPRN